MKSEEISKEESELLSKFRKDFYEKLKKEQEEIEIKREIKQKEIKTLKEIHDQMISNKCKNCGCYLNEEAYVEKDKTKKVCFDCFTILMMIYTMENRNKKTFEYINDINYVIDFRKRHLKHFNSKKIKSIRRKSMKKRKEKQIEIGIKKEGTKLTIINLEKEYYE